MMLCPKYLMIIQKCAKQDQALAKEATEIGQCQWLLRGS